MFRLRLIPLGTNIPFMKARFIAFSLSGFLALVSLGLFFTQGLNKGIDFAGGIMIEVATKGPADLAKMRSAMSGLGLGEVALQEFGSPNDVLIRIERQKGGDEAQNAAVKKAKAALKDSFPDISFRRVEFVGPKVSGELVVEAAIAIALSVLAMLVYIWFRFELQFGLGAVLALVHDVIMTIGFFSALRLEFNLSSVAAVLTIVGYSINDTVVVYDRIRENLRRFKQMPLPELLNLSINETLSRTVMNSLTTLLALVALYALGGEVIRGFTLAMIWGIVVGTYSSIFVAAPILLLLKLDRKTGDEDDEENNNAEGIVIEG